MLKYKTYKKIEKLIKEVEDKYNVELVQYNGVRQQALFKCKKHGLFSYRFDRRTILNSKCLCSMCLYENEVK